MSKKRTGLASDLRIARLVEISNMRRAGKSAEEIAEFYGIRTQTVNTWFRRLKKEWRAEAVEKYSGWLLEEIGRLLEARQEAFDAWRRSIGQQKVITREGRIGQDAEGRETIKPQKVTIREEVSPGDPRFLAVVAQIDQQFIKLLGLEAPARVDLKQTVDGHVEHGGIDYEAFAAAYAAYIRGKADAPGVATAGTDGQSKPVDPAGDQEPGVPVDQAGPVPDGADS